MCDIMHLVRVGRPTQDEDSPARANAHCFPRRSRHHDDQSRNPDTITRRDRGTAPTDSRKLPGRTGCPGSSGSGVAPTSRPSTGCSAPSGIRLGLGLGDTLIVSGAGQPDRDGRLRALRADGPAHRGDRHGAVARGVRPARRLPPGGDPGAAWRSDGARSTPGSSSTSSWLCWARSASSIPRPTTTAGRSLVAALIMAIQVAISWPATRRSPPSSGGLCRRPSSCWSLMSVVAWTHLDIDWGYAGPARRGPDRHRPHGPR